MKWEGKRIYLRFVKMHDLDQLLQWENNPEIWDVSATHSPYTVEEMVQFIVDQAYYQESGQLRLIICLKDGESIGAIDLFEIDKQSKQAGVGVLIHDKLHRNKGYAKEALNLLKQVSTDLFSLEKLYATVHQTNQSSCCLFQNCKFKLINVLDGINHYEYNLLQNYVKV